MLSTILRTATAALTGPRPTNATNPGAATAQPTSASTAAATAAPPTSTDGYSSGGLSRPLAATATATTSSAAAAAADPSLLSQLSSALTAARTGATAMVGGRGPAAPTAEAAAAALYTQHGDKPFDLRKPDQVLDLIRHSPQIDASTGKDPANDGESRCATAATTNALLLSKASAANAEALRKTVADYGLAPTAAQTDAIDALERGRMSPNQAAQVQELLYDAVRANGRQAAGGRQGMTGNDLLDLNATLKKHGAFGGAQIEYKLQAVTDAAGNTVPHWTTEVRADNLTRTMVDSWPGRDGRARVTQGLAYSTNGSSLAEGSRTPRNLLGEIALIPYEDDRGAIDTAYVRRERTAPGSATVQEWTWDHIFADSIPKTRVAPDRTYAL